MTTYPRAIAAIGALSAYTAAQINNKVDSVLTHLNNLIGGVDDYEKLRGKVQSVTIASDIITASNDYIVVDTEGAAASDNLTTINGYAEGRVIFIRMANAARVVTLVHGTGTANPSLAGNGSVILSATKWKALIGTTTGWTDAGVGFAGELIYARVALGVGSPTITLPSIPATFKHLRLIAELRSDKAATLENCRIQFNGDTTAANYVSEFTYSNATTTTSGESLTAVGGLVPVCVNGATSTANRFGLVIFDIANYASVNAGRAIRHQGGARSGVATGTIYNEQGVVFWENTSAAINQIVLLPDTGTNFAPGSAVSLYGLN